MNTMTWAALEKAAYEDKLYWPRLELHQRLPLPKDPFAALEAYYPELKDTYPDRGTLIDILGHLHKRAEYPGANTTHLHYQHTVMTNVLRRPQQHPYSRSFVEWAEEIRAIRPTQIIPGRVHVFPILQSFSCDTIGCKLYVENIITK